LAKQVQKGARFYRDLATFPVLGGARLQPDGAGYQIDLPHPKVQEFADSPAIGECGLQQRTEPQLRAVGNQLGVLCGGNEPLPNVLLLQVWDA
jgi:hypothetical protein